MGIFYTQPLQILSENDLSYIHHEILTEGFNPYQSIKKFFKFLIQKIKDFFAKIFSKKPEEKETSGETKLPPGVKKPKRVPADVTNARSELKSAEAELKNLENSLIKLPASLPLTMSYFDADKGVHTLTDGIHDLQNMCIEELGEVAKAMDKMIQAGNHASFYHVSKNKFMGERARKGAKDVKHDLRNLVKIKSVTVDVSKLVGLFVFIPSDYFTHSGEYEKQLSALVIKATERIENGLNSIVRQYEWLEEEEELMPFQSHVSTVINNFAHLVKVFQNMFNEKNNSLSIHSLQTISSYNEDKQEWITDQTKIAGCKERIKFLKEYLAKFDDEHMADEV